MTRNHWIYGLSLGVASMLWLMPGRTIAADDAGAVPAVQTTAVDGDGSARVEQVRHRHRHHHGHHHHHHGFFGGWGYPGFGVYYGRPYYSGYYYPRYYGYAYPYYGGYAYRSYPYSYGYWW